MKQSTPKKRKNAIGFKSVMSFFKTKYASKIAVTMIYGYLSRKIPGIPPIFLAISLNQVPVSIKYIIGIPKLLVNTTTLIIYTLALPRHINPISLRLVHPVILELSYKRSTDCIPSSIAK